MLKRLFDIILSFSGLIILSLLFLVLIVLVKIFSPGPAFYKSERVGKGGERFKMLKFRTMVQGADKMGGPSTAADDKRLTRTGSFLKRFQLDELPQLFNVLKGEMSLVGPRPEVPFYVNMMTEEEKNIILSVRPGMTDIASIWNFHEGDVLKGSPDPEKTYQEKIRPKKIELQKKYIREKSLLLDFKIVLKTIAKIFK